jgi:hypothetical protein
VGDGGPRFAGARDVADLAAFLARATRLDPATLVRLRRAGPGAGPPSTGQVVAFLRLPFGVLVSRAAAVAEAPADVTVGAAALLERLDAVGVDGWCELPERQDARWRGALPPADGWTRLDRVPAGVLLRLVRAGADTLRSAGALGSTEYGQALLGHESLTVSGADLTVALPLKVLSAVSRMGFLGDPSTAADGSVLVSAAGRWARVAAPYGSAYHQLSAALSLQPR